MALLAHSIGADVRALVVIAAVVWLFNRLVLVPRRDPLRRWVGPKADSAIMGNLRRIFASEPGAIHLKWSREYGGVVRYWGFLGESRLLVSDPAALTHILLQRSYDCYPKPAQVRGELGRILGRGVLFAEGDDHKRQRRAMNPAFNKAQTDALVPLFFEQSQRLLPIWSAEVDGADGAGPVIDVSKDLSRLTLDIIGLAGFGTQFNSLDAKAETSPLAGAFSKMFSASSPGFPLSRILVIILMRYLPWLAQLPTKRLKAVKASFAVMESEADKLTAAARERIAAGDEAGGKDLLSLLIRSNSELAKSRMTDAEVRGQITTILLAGHETTSTALTWILHLLSTRPAVQERLRAEVRKAFAAARAQGKEYPTADELLALPYLDAVSREGLRLIPPVSATIRTSLHDDEVPLSKPVTLPDGSVANSVPVRKGMTIFLSIVAINQNKEIFGEDADEFNPDRWLKNDFSGAFEGHRGFSTYNPLLTFLGGPRSCIGYRFAVTEYRAILATLIDAYAFAPRDDATSFEAHSQIVTRPYVVGDVKAGPQMPLRVTRAA